MGNTEVAYNYVWFAIVVPGDILVKNGVVVIIRIPTVRGEFGVCGFAIHIGNEGIEYDRWKVGVVGFEFALHKNEYGIFPIDFDVVDLGSRFTIDGHAKLRCFTAGQFEIGFNRQVFGVFDGDDFGNRNGVC